MYPEIWTSRSQESRTLGCERVALYHSLLLNHPEALKSTVPGCGCCNNMGHDLFVPNHYMAYIDLYVEETKEKAFIQPAVTLWAAHGACSGVIRHHQESVMLLVLLPPSFILFPF
jgi:hypothetical protein